MNLLAVSLLSWCIGVTCEVVFTSLRKLRTTWDTSLRWESYVYMIFIYGLIPLLFSFFYQYIESYSLVLRLFVIVLCIYSIEYIFWYLLEKLIWKCPWKYTEWLHINGYIRLDYIGFWCVFAYFIELLVFYFEII
jgi:hypothetical protein